MLSPARWEAPARAGCLPVCTTCCRIWPTTVSSRPLLTVTHRQRDLCWRPRCTRWSISPSFSPRRHLSSVAATSNRDEQRSDENCRPRIGGCDGHDVCGAAGALDRHAATATGSECDRRESLSEWKDGAQDQSWFQRPGGRLVL